MKTIENLENEGELIKTAGEGTCQLWEFAGQLLAFFNIYTYEIGEQAILNVSFREALKICQKKFNIQNGETPNFYGITLLIKYIKEGKKNPKSSWIKEIVDRYKLKGFKKILT